MLLTSALMLASAPSFAQGAPPPAATAVPPGATPAAAASEPVQPLAPVPVPVPAPEPAPPSAAAPSSATDALPAPVPVSAAPVSATPAPRGDSAGLDFTADDAERARFSGGRLAAGIVGSALGGSAAAYGTYKGICGDEPCVGGALAGLGANLVVTPLLSYGIGRLMGGRGTFGSVLLGATLGFGIGAPFMTHGNTGLIIGLALMPIMGPLAFEFSSSGKSRAMKLQLGSLQLSPYLAASTRSTHGALRLPTTYGFAGVF